MSLTDFLFNGSPPPSVTTYGNTTSNLPTWYSDYTQGLIAKANSVAAEPYQAYPGPRVADFNSDQTSSFDATRANTGTYNPALQAGIATAAGAASANPQGAADPYEQTAAQSSAGLVGQYMSPYINDVVNREAQLGQRNLSENLLPQIGDQFTAAGQFGSSRQQEMQNRAVRDTNESIMAQQANSLNQGYQGALTAAQTDLSRVGQAGQVMGNLAATDQSNRTTAANSMYTGAQAGQTMNLKDEAALSAIGQQQQNQDQTNLNTAYGDFQNQVAYPEQQIGFLSNAIRGIQLPTSTSTSATVPSINQSPTGLSQIATGLGGLSSLLGKAKGGLVRRPQGALSRTLQAA